MKHFSHILAVLVATCHLSSVQAADKFKLTALYPNAEVFKTLDKDIAAIELIDGTIEYRIDSADEGEGEGYWPTSTQEIQADLSRVIYDHEGSETSLSVFRNIKAELEKKDFDVLYSCARSECGDVAGWRLYLSRYIEGLEQGQYYLLAEHPRKNGGTWHIAIYINEFTGRARTLVDISSTFEVAYDRFAIDQSKLGVRLQEGEAVALHHGLFAIDSAKIRTQFTDELEIIAQSLKDDKAANIEIRGYADKTGSDQHNLELSQQRAEAVRQHLISEFGISEARLSALGLGAVEQIDGITTAQQLRRVELVKVSTTTTAGTEEM